MLKRSFARRWVSTTLFILATTAGSMAAERQITNDSTQNCALDQNHNFSPDGKWLVYDLRPNGGLQNCRSIEKVNVVTGERVRVYDGPDFVENMGPGIAAPSYLPERNEVIFIHGPFTTTGLAYDMARRTGAIVPDDGSAMNDTSRITWADARDVTPPFTPGALRGGTHRHDPGGPGGLWIGYTYNDQIMKRYGQQIGRDLDLRMLGLTKLGIPVSVDADPAHENRSGAGFSVVITEVFPKDELDREPGTDRIYRATDDQWVGTRGYRKPDGSWQLARAFIGHMRVRAADGSVRDHREVFIVDIPEDITRPGPAGPLEGTGTTFPAPPAGTSQRRLTHTDSGCFGLVRSTSDGGMIAFLSRAADGTPQVFVVSPLGGEPRQITSFPGGASHPVRWLPDDLHFVTVSEGRVYVVDAASGCARAITEPSRSRPDGLVVSPDGKLVAFNREVVYASGKFAQVFVADIELP
ncbi:MAG TPA: DUF3748 domain-containing protein [Candidatus Latescibacteria bacterium]|nr:DUF3748 domain-containing protein [Candidatus Latescibacterota bacterium]HPC44920.1 DUF3748 domain-containing protein [Candidatus Latescibacterota bacterium]HQI76396.1 DUF3748 domain-containing protein [Candidatus Latescibacterota bacterium]